MNTYKITLTAINYKIKSENISSSEQKLFQKIFDGDYVEDLNIEISSRRKKGSAYFVDFVSTNNKTIEENLFDYYNPEELENQNFKKFTNQLLKELDFELSRLNF